MTPAGTNPSIGMGSCPNEAASKQPHEFQLVQGVTLNPYTKSQAAMLFCVKCGSSWLLGKDGWRHVPVSSESAVQQTNEDESETETGGLPPTILGAKRRGQ